MKTTTATLWTLAARQSDRVIGVVSIAVLARLLTPADFGLVTLGNSIVAIFEVLTAFGFDWAIVRLREPTREHYDTAWTLRVLLGAGVFVAVCLVAWPLSIYLADARILPLLLALATISVLGSTVNIGFAEFRRTMQFDKEFTVATIAKVLSFVAAAGVAFASRSYWALVVGAAVSRAVNVALSYWMHPFRPTWSLRHRSELMSFSMWILLNNIIETARGRLTDIWIGRLFGPHGVGIFSMSREFASLATSEFAAPINRVAFSRYAQANGTVEDLRGAFTQITGIIWSVGLPAAAGVAVCAQKIVRLVLGQQWAEATVILQILAVGGALQILNANTGYVFLAIDRGRFLCVTSLLNIMIFVAVALALLESYGMVGLAGAEALATLPILLIVYGALRAWLGVSVTEIALRNWRVVAATGAMAWIVSTFQVHVVDSLNLPLAGKLVLLVGLGASSYVVLLAAIWILTGTRAGPEEYFASLARNVFSWIFQQAKARIRLS